MTQGSVRAVVGAARQAARECDAPLLLAVSGGLDSMAMLHAMWEGARARVAMVATFDHGVGRAATRASALVAREAGRLGFTVVTGHADARAEGASAPSEAVWRRERHEFLRRTAAPLGARVVTAHTEDDQVETILMRVLRGSGARGLAALAARGLALRPFLGVRRVTLEAYARSRGVRWIDDPTNASRAFLRNRVRHDLLPALRSADPRFDAALLEVAARAAAWRDEVDLEVATALRPRHEAADSVSVLAAELGAMSVDSLCVIWSSLAARVGLALDRRGTRRLATFTSEAPAEGRIPLSGGWLVVAGGGRYRLFREREPIPTAARALEGDAVEWGEFVFRAVTAAECARGGHLRGESWAARLAVEGTPLVRAWSPGDRLLPSEGQPRRRVKRYLSEAGVRGVDRTGWPVVVSGEDVVWIPGVRRSDAATARSGRPVRHFLCERTAR